MAPNITEYNLWKFFKQTQFSVDPSEDTLYRYSFTYLLLNQFSNLESLSFKTTYDGNSPYFFLETIIPQNKKVEMDKGLDYFLKLLPKLKIKSQFNLDNKSLIGRLIGEPGEIAVIDFNPNGNLSSIYVEGFYGELNQAPSDLSLKYLQGISANSKGEKLD